MQAILTGVFDRDSKFGGKVFLLTFRGDDDKSYQSWISPTNRNFKNWESIIQGPIGVTLYHLRVKGGNLINADSFPKLIN